jgi:ribosome maturation factor RimP
MPNPMTTRIRQTVEPAIQGAGYDLVELEFKREPGGWVVRVYIDRTDGTLVSIEDCERVSRELSPVLDVADVIPQAYSLEVSSPGLDRPLRTPEHFRRFVGERAKIKLALGVDGRKNFTGTIVAVPDNDHLDIDVDGQRFTLPLGDLDKANLVYNFEQQAKRE